MSSRRYRILTLIPNANTDSFSRRVLWLEVSTSNKMPEIIAKYYLDAVKQNDLPVNVKVDDNTEHSLVQPIQLPLRNIDRSDLSIV